MWIFDEGLGTRLGPESGRRTASRRDWQCTTSTMDNLQASA